MPTDFLHGIETIEPGDGIRSIRTTKSSIIGLIGTAPAADDTAWPLNTPILVLGDRRNLTDLGATGTLPDAFDGIFDQVGAAIVVVRVEEGADIDATLTNIVGSNADDSGVHAFTKAEAMVGYEPRILCAPGFTSQRPGAPAAANPVVSELIGIAERLRAIIVADGPNTTKEDANTYAGDFGSDRLFVVDPAITIFKGGSNVVDAASARVAGLFAKMDLQKGFWHSPSNQVINGIVGSARAIDFRWSDANTEANYLNEQGVATIIRDDGFRLWGNRSQVTDPQWAFISVRRTADMVYESVEAAHRWAIDKPFSTQILVDIAESVNAYLRTLKARGAILGGKAWIDTHLNTAATMKAGQLFVSFDIEPPAPIERLTFVAYRNDAYYTELTEQAARELAQLAA